MLPTLQRNKVNLLSFDGENQRHTFSEYQKVNQIKVGWANSRSVNEGRQKFFHIMFFACNIFVSAKPVLYTPANQQISIEISSKKRREQMTK